MIRSAPLLLGLLTAIRLAVAAAVPLSPDEAYYWVWSRALQAGYLDHPPMVALWIRAGTALAGETALGVRLLAPLAAAAGSWLLADAARRLYPDRTIGMAAACLLNATLMIGAGGVTMTPDTPLLFFAVLTLWAMVRAGADGRWWLLAGVAVGAGLDSKYTAVLLGLAGPIWLVWTGGGRALRSAWPWAGGAVALAVFAPAIGWNAAHGWASFLKQGGRTGNWEPDHAGRFLGELALGQVGLATPGIAALFAAGLWAACRAARREPSARLLVTLAVPGLALFVQHAFGARVQANWLAVVYPPLAIGAAAIGRRWWRPACGVGFAITAIVYLQAAAAPVPLPRSLDPTLIRLAGWDGLARQADTLRREQGLAFLASDDYGQAAELAWWAPAGTIAIGAEDRWRFFGLPRPAPGEGLLLISERRAAPPDPALWSDVRPVGVLSRGRGGVEAERFRVYRARLDPTAAAAELPRRGGE